MRSFTSYIKVQKFLGKVLRNRKLFLNSKKWEDRQFLDLGVCEVVPLAPPRGPLQIAHERVDT